MVVVVACLPSSPRRHLTRTTSVLVGLRKIRTRAADKVTFIFIFSSSVFVFCALLFFFFCSFVRFLEILEESGEVVRAMRSADDSRQITSVEELSKTVR